MVTSGIGVAVADLRAGNTGLDAIVAGVTAVEYSTDARSVGFVLPFGAEYAVPGVRLATPQECCNGLPRSV